MLRLIAGGSPVAPVRSAWRVDESRRYVYISTRGRPPKDISSESDVDWPFTVEGEFDDDTLISIVDFIRSKPGIPVPAFRKEVIGAPISFIARRDDAIYVALRTGEFTGDEVWLPERMDNG
jgi:hypothetical protein